MDAAVFQERDVRMAGTLVPRYTSYPTAPMFHDRVDGCVYVEWLRALTADQTLSLYLHVPYCKSLCAYCGCHTFAVRRDEPVADYTCLLIRHIEAVAAATPARRVVHIHWGGGTPGILGPARIRAVYDVMARCFDLGGLHEHAIELDPRFLTAELVDTLAEIGVNRVSFGVQDLNPHVQHAIGRVQPLSDLVRANDLVRSAGIAAVNMDLIYGLPLQTTADVVATLEQILPLQPDRLAVFGYAHVPWFKSRQKLIVDPHLPDAAERLEQATVLQQHLIAAGYVAVGLDHFARPADPMAVAAGDGTLRRNFQGYTTDAADALIGFGVSAISQLPQGYAQVSSALAPYKAALDVGTAPIARGWALSAADRVRADMIEAIMCFGRVAVPTTWSAERDRLAPYIDAGYAAWEGAVLAVTSRGRPFTRLMAACLDAYLDNTAGRHAIAV
jgi:oxygen-independent coproporphyrinogen-3 oxidase